MAYTTINKSTDHFFTKLWTGTNAGETISGIPFQPDFNWTKQRTGTQDHVLVDAVRGVEKTLFSNATDSEYTLTDGITAWTSDGFTHGTNNIYCEAGNTFASWSWKANGSGSANTEGSINSTVSANTTSGFSVVTWTGDNSATGTIGHGLGVAPSVIMVKRLDSADNWYCYWKPIGNTKVMYLDLNNGESGASSNYWNNSDPTTTVFSFGAAFQSTGNYVAYCFAEKTGYCRVGSYIGNGNADAPFIYCGFKPEILLGKRTDGSGQNWFLIDTTRQEYNNRGNVLYPETTTAEGTTYYIDMLSNGWKWNVAGSGENGSGNTYIFMAIGQTLVGTNDTPATAR